MKISIILAIFRKDLLDSFRNYQVLLMVLTPIILSLILSNLFKEPKEKTLLPKVGIISSPQQPLLERFTAENSGIKLVFYQTITELESGIIEGEVGFGLVLPSFLIASGPTFEVATISIFYPSDLPNYAVDRLQVNLERELRRFLNLPVPPLPIKLELKPVGGRIQNNRSFSGDLFPMLVLMAMGMVGFLGLPLSFVEEKEKKTLHAIFLSPVTSGELIIGKSLFWFALIISTILIMQIVNGRFEGDQLYFWALSCLGSALCIFIGLLISFYAPNQGAVNAIGTSIFMFFQLIPNLSQSSDFLKTVSPIMPSTFIMRGLKKAMFMDLSKVDISFDLGIISCLTLLLYLVVFLCFRYRQYKV